MKRLVLIVGFFLAIAIGENGLAYDGYPYKNSPCLINGECPSYDPYGFCRSHCTSYVAWKLNEFWNEIGCGNVEFNNSFSGMHWGNAYEWKSVAESLGFPVIDYPIKGEVAWWGQSPSMLIGHVAFIEEVIGQEEGIIISEYNYNQCSFSVRKIIKNDPGYPDAFLIVGYRTFELRDMGMCDEYEANNPDNSDPGGGCIITPTPSTSSKKPELFVKEFGFKNSKRGYYEDENITLEAKIKNAGKSVDKKITKIKLEYYRFEGEKENGDIRWTALSRQ